ncbi:MAG TPA: cyclic nucleotide-binding domain-containing protein, partial [Ktedonobacteraceae bacterium]|nr:cyclic nucleotide-binding domain-containing protein [Ktedonobacteraceae bacterium]
MTIQPSKKAPIVVGLEHRGNLRPFTEEEVRFEIDMCIGCDRCMRACPVPLSAQVSIADLNRATISDVIAPHVARFTDECVMCGSCVPVCPVDNHRDLLMLSLKQRLGISWDGNVDMSRVLHYLPAGWNTQLLISRLRELPMFSDPQLVPENYLLHFVATSKLLTLLPGSVVLREGEFGRDMYFILEGRFELSTQGSNGEALPVAVLRRGEYMGEQGMLTGQQRNATARAQTSAVVLEVPEQVMQRLMEIVPAVRTFFDRLHTMRSIEATLKRMALFQGIADGDIQRIAEQTQVRRYDRDEQLFSEDNRLRRRQTGETGQPARESLHLLLEGFVKVSRRTQGGTEQAKSDERIIAYRQGGDYFVGGLDLLGDGHAVTVTAINRASAAEVPRPALLALFNRYPEVAQRFQMRLQQYRDAAVAAQTSIQAPLAEQAHGQAGQARQDRQGDEGAINRANQGAMNWANQGAINRAPTDAEARAGLRALVGGGVVEGTEVLVINLEKCIHCNECEEACARRHGHSRMNRKGMVVGNITIATACRQCQDPVCMLCSRAGIARRPSGEVYITESCIGCGICAERCPYDNIKIMTLEDEDEQPDSWQKFSGFFRKGSGKERGRKLLPMAGIAAPGRDYSLSPGEGA